MARDVEKGAADDRIFASPRKYLGTYSVPSNGGFRIGVIANPSMPNPAWTEQIPESEFLEGNAPVAIDTYIIDANAQQTVE